MSIVRLGIFLLLCFNWQISIAKVDIESTKQQRSTTRLINYFMEKYHYKKVTLDNALSEKILHTYLKDLDPNRNYFLASDIKHFQKYRHRLDELLKKGDVKVAFIIFNIYQSRLQARVSYAKQRLTQPFDFTRNETYQFDRSKAKWAKDNTELDEIWRKRVKNDVLNLRLAKKPNDKIIETLSKRYDRLLTRSNQLKAEDVFQLFMNAYAVSIEPHTAYFSPRATDNFKINMRLSLEGIGAVLQLKNEYTMIRKTVPGGPAEASNQIHAGDRIIGVGQADKEIVNVIGWRLDDVVDLIRGPKGTLVKLQVLPKSASPGDSGKIVKIIRDKIKLEEQAAQKSVETVETANGPIKIGIIDIPTFYSDLEARSRGDKDFRSTTRDVHRLLVELKKENVAGIVIDLSSDGGGSLSEAIDLTGLFIDTGPVVQVKDSSNKIDIDKDEDPLVAYRGPLAILVDRYSASASEIFAGAIQDYKRGIIIGEPTFGKGTVQTLIDLDRFSREPNVRLGQLKVTIAQFFRINGDSTQHRGVTPDIIFPVTGDPNEYGESALDNALAWAQVKPRKYKTYQVSQKQINQVKAKHEQRVKKDAGFEFLKSEVTLLQQIKDKKNVTLNEKKRQQERNERKQKRLALYNAYRVARGLEPKEKLDDDTDEDEDDLVEEKDDKDKEPDIRLLETTAILADWISLQPIARDPFASTP